MHLHLNICDPMTSTFNSSDFEFLASSSNDKKAQYSAFPKRPTPIRSQEDTLVLVHIQGFQVTSYQANFASHHTRNQHVGFLFARPGIGKHNKMFHNFSYRSDQNTTLQHK